MSPSRERPSKKIFSFHIFYFKGRKKVPFLHNAIGIGRIEFSGDTCKNCVFFFHVHRCSAGVVNIWFKFLGPNKKGCGRVDNVVRKQDGILMIGGRSESNNTTSCTKEISGSVTCPPHSTTTRLVVVIIRGGGVDRDTLAPTAEKHDRTTFLFFF